MATFKKFVDFFVTIEDGESTDAPKKAANKDPNVAAQAAREFVEDGHEDVGQGGQRVRVGDLPTNSGSTIGEELSAADMAMLAEMEAELAQPGPAAQRAASDSGAPRRSLDDMDGMGDLDGQEDSPSFSLSAFDGVELEVKSFDEIYLDAGLSTADSEEFTIFTVRDLLGSEHLQNLPMTTKRASLLVAMQARGVNVEQVITDAYERDHAIDMHDEELAAQLDAIQMQLEEKNSELQAEMERMLEEMRLKIEENNHALDAARHVYQEWRALKEQEEGVLFEAVSPFVEREENPITVDN